jgi:hypothetical protein
MTFVSIASCVDELTQPHMAATLHPLPIPPRLWHTVGLGYLTHLLVSNGFDSVLIVIDHVTQTAHFLQCT